MIVLVTSPDSHSVATNLSWKRNTQRKLKARKNAWEGGRKSVSPVLLHSFLPLIHREFIKPLITCWANTEKLIGYESVANPDLYLHTDLPIELQETDGAKTIKRAHGTSCMMLGLENCYLPGMYCVPRRGKFEVAKENLFHLA